MLPLSAGQLQPQLLGDFFRYLLLYRKNISEPAIVLLPPEFAVVSGIHQFETNYQTVALLRDFSREHCTHTQFLPNLFRIDRLSFEAED